MLLVTECKNCNSSLISIKLFNKWDIDKKIILGVACGLSVTLSTYFVYKLWKLNKNLNKSIDTMNNLTRRFETVANDLAKITTQKDNSTPETSKFKTKSNIILPDESTTSNDIKSSKKISRASSVASLSDYYETPLTSPQESSSSSDDEDDNEIDQFKDPIEENIDVVSSQQPQPQPQQQQQQPLKSALKNRKLDDNILTLIHQPLDYLKNLVKKTEEDYNNDEKNVENLIEYIKSLFALAERTDGDYNFVKESHFKCRDLAHKALDLNDKIYLTHKWRAVTIGRVIEYLGVQDKVRASIDFKKHLDIAISLNEDDYYLLYMRGRWAYGLCNLNRVEKYAVKLIYGDMPSCKMECALEDFLKAEKLYPKKFKGNILYLAKSYIHFNEIKKALDCLNDGVKLSCKTSIEQTEHQEIKALLDKYSNS